MVQPKQLIQQLLGVFGYTITKKVNEVSHQSVEYPFVDVLKLVVQDYLQHNPDIFFIQIGAHDGASADLLSQLVKRYHWRGLLVEPQPATFKRLVQNYQTEEQLIFENSVISQTDGTTTFYSVREQEPPLPALLQQAASLNRDTVASALFYWKIVKQHPAIPADFESLIEATPLPSLTINSLLSKHQIENVDLLMVDAMGYDWQIIQLFPFDRMKPPIVQFEHSQLSPTDREACLTHLAGFGYSFAKFAGDTIAYLQPPAFRWAVTDW